MSKYTTELRFICEQFAGYSESKGFSNIEEVLDNSWDKNTSSIKEGDITISYDTSISKGALIQKTLNDLNNRYSTYIRML